MRKLKSETLEDGIEERVPYEPRIFCCIARLHEKDLFSNICKLFYRCIPAGALFKWIHCSSYCLACLPACSAYNISNCALLLHAHFACGKQCDSPSLVGTTFYFFLKVNILLWHKLKHFT